MVTKRAKRFGLYIIMFILAFAAMLSACSSTQTVYNAPQGTGDTTEPAQEPIDEPVVDMQAYRIRLWLTCTVKGDDGQNKEINCTYDGKTQAEIDREIFAVESGKTFSGLQAATPPKGYTVGASEYKFTGWYYTDNGGNRIKVDENTVFTTETFGNYGEITLKADCERVFSPTMPL